MFDVKPYIYEKLIEIGVSVTDSYPEKFNEFPLISYIEIESSDKGICGFEVLDKVTVQIDVWVKDSTLELKKLCDKVNDKMYELGFRRIISQDMSGDIVKRKTMRFSAVINTKTNRVYQD
jgi:hypothetical protein